MIENALLGQSSFVGRDGFRWWIGQIAPRQAQVTQNSTGDGWGNRYKVRIMGYHPFTEEVTDQDLPYAQVMLPVTAGSGEVVGLSRISLSFLMCCSMLSIRFASKAVCVSNYSHSGV